MEMQTRPLWLSLPILFASLSCFAPAQDPAVAPEAKAVQVDPRAVAALRSAPSRDQLEKLEAEVSHYDGVARMRADAKLWFLKTVSYCSKAEEESNKKIKALEEQRRKHERDSDQEGVEQVAEKILVERQQMELAYSLFHGDRSGGPSPSLSRLFVDLKGPFGPQLAQYVAESSLPELKRDLQAASRRSKIPADREEARRLIGRIDEVLSKIEKGDLSGADDVLRQEWQRIVEPEGGGSAAPASDPSIPDTARVAWPVGVRDEQARQRWEKAFDSKTEDPSQPIEAWRLMLKRSYVLYFVGMGEALTANQQELDRLKKELAECKEMGDTAGTKVVAERIQSVEKIMEDSSVTRFSVASSVGFFFLPAISGLGREGAVMYAESLENLGRFFGEQARGGSPTEVERAKWLIHKAGLAAGHLRAGKHSDAERVCDEVVRWILDAGEPLQHEPGSPSFGNLAGK